MRTEGFPADLYNHPAWIAWKESLGWKSLRTGLGFTLLIRPIGSGFCMAYAVPPDLEDTGHSLILDAGAALERLSHRVLPFLPQSTAFIRWDLMAGPWRDSGGSVLDPRLQELRMNASTALRRLRKSLEEQVDLETMAVDLRGGEKAILRRFHKRALYSLRLAERRGTSVERLGEAALGEFYSLYKETMARKEGVAEEFAYFSELFRSSRLWGLDLDLYLARREGKPAAAAIIASHSDTSWYLFSASSADLPSSAGPSAILAAALADGSARGGVLMDLMGVAPADFGSHRLAGVTFFKAGFGGSRLSRAGAWDYIVKPAAYSRLP